MRNPQMFQQFQSLVKSKNDPNKILSDMTSKYSPEQMKQFMQFANGFGITNEQLSKYGIK